MSTAQLEQIAESWKPLASIVTVPRTEFDYLRLSTMLDELTDIVGEDEFHPLASLMDVIGTLIESYEGRHVSELQA